MIDYFINLMSRYPTKAISVGKIGLAVSFDTFQNKEGYDRLIKNLMRLSAIYLMYFSYAYPLPGWFVMLNAIGILVGMVFVGITKLEYLQHDRQQCIFEAWG